MYIKSALFIFVAGLFSLGSCDQTAAVPNKPKPVSVNHSGRPVKIQLALLLDTSGSMEGLIGQAKSRLWNVVNTLTTLRYNGEVPKIEIALYEYGNSGLAPESNYIRQISPLSADLDMISEKLFSLYTNGGDEYCGAVINDATKKLDWGNNEGDMKLIYIAGNEEFDQGFTHYSEAIAKAREKNIYVNTIFCGERYEGINTFWKKGAMEGGGNFFTINQDEAIAYIETPYDQEIARNNERLNLTYIQYGALGEAKKSNQAFQDIQANGLSSCVATDRTITKSQSVYDNTSWDLVDKARSDKNALKSLKKEELPKELKGKSQKEIEKYVAEKAAERTKIQKIINELGQKRQAYIDRQAKEKPRGKDLGSAIRQSVIAFAKTKGYTVAQ